MKLSTLLLIILPLAAVMTVTKTSAQANASINILTQNSGQVGINNTIFIQVDVGNTGPTNDIGPNKVRAQISVPVAIVNVLSTPEQTGLPAGWTVVTNSLGGITVCNGSDVIPVNAVRTVLIAVKGVSLGGPSTVTGVLSFGPGTGVCTGPGSLAGDITADNTSNSSILVSTALPLTLTSFDAELVNCQPTLRWTTETEVNTDHFELERSNEGNADWSLIGNVRAHGLTTSKTQYSFVDRTVNQSTDKQLYRLKMIDQDGKYKYSNVLSVFTNCNATKVYVYPNPALDGKLYVSLTGTTGYTQASLLSLSGQLLLKINMHNGTNYLDVSAIADGIYILNIKDANGVDRKTKVSIQH